MIRLYVAAALLMFTPPAFATVNARSAPFSAFCDHHGANHDDAAAIQAAIDYAFSIGDGEITIDPPGDCRVSVPIYLDPPSNLRVSLANPTQFSFSAALSGGRKPGITIGATTLWADFNNQCVLWIGTGQGMAVNSISISGPPVTAAGFRLGLPPAGAGFCIAGGGGGATRTLLDNASSNLLYGGVVVGANGNGNLGDSTTIRKCNITAAVGVAFTQTNNLINEVDDCVVDAVIGVQANSWNGVHVRGGNYSANLNGNVFPMIGISVDTLQQGGGQTAYQITITAVIAAPDAFFLAGAYNAFAMTTQHYGVVPMALTGWNAVTGVATFVVLDAYSGSYFAGWGNDPATKTNLIAELQASAKLYAAEMVTTFQGLEIHADGIHIENGSTPTLLLDGYYGTPQEGSAHSDLRNVRINGNLTASAIGPAVIAGTASPALQAQYYIARSWPNLRIGYTETTVEDLTMNATDERLIVDFKNPVARLNWRGAGPKLQLRTPISGYPFTVGPIALAGTVYKTGSPAAFGAGDFEANPFYATMLMSDADSWRGPWGQGRSPMQGIRPAPWATPGVTVAQAAMLAGTLPPLTLPGSGSINVQYPLLWGGQVYRLQDWYLGLQPSYQLASSHHFYSYGQALPVSWSHIGQSSFLYVNDTRLLFPGLGIQIDNGDGSGPLLYLVTGVYPQMGYVTVLKGVESDNGPWLLTGNQTRVYTGSSIGQEPYVITRF